MKSEKGQDVPIWQRERILPLRAPFATTVWDFIHRAIPVGNEGTLTPDEVYSLTAYLLFVNKVIPEDTVLDKQTLPKVKMPIGDDYGRLPDWKPGTPRLPGYPYCLEQLLFSWKQKLLYCWRFASVADLRHSPRTV